MKHLILTTFIILTYFKLHAQNGQVVAGGDATGSGGTATYSLGQVAYTQSTDNDTTVSNGIQKPIIISTTLGNDETSINLKLAIYPNPTPNILVLQVEEKARSLSYKLHDLQGRIIQAEKITKNSTTINLEGKAHATYVLSIIENGTIIKSFKIIKQ